MLNLDAPVPWDLPPEIEFVLGQVRAALCYIDSDRRYRYMNARFSHWAGVSPEEAVGSSILEVGCDALHRRVGPQIERVLRGEVERFEGEVPGHDGRNYWVRTIMIPDRTECGVRGYLLMIQDVTRRKRAELALEVALERGSVDYAERLAREVEARTTEFKNLQGTLLRAERLSITEAMAGSVAHSVNNPLAALLGTVEMALAQMVDPYVAFERIHHLARRIEGVVEGTLRLFRGGRMNLEPQSCRALFERVVREIEPRAQRSGIRIEQLVAAELPVLAADGAMLSAALTCIAENALQVTPDGGEILLEAEALRNDRIVRFRVSDAGPGIPESLRARVVEPFFTTKGGGTGLGLAIANGVVQGHKGSLRFDSRPGGGTIVTIELPAVHN